jgi:predicted phage tail protein
MIIIGAGGGGDKGGGGSSRTPSTSPDSLDSRQYANIIDLISEGEIEGLVDGMKSIYINDTPLQSQSGQYNFKDVEIEVRNGAQIQPYIPFASAAENEIPVGITVVKDVPIVRTITNDEIDEVRVTISVPSLQQITPSTGDTVGTKVEIEIAVQYAGGGWTAKVSGTDGTITGRTGDEYRIDYLIKLNRPSPLDNVDIRVTRITADSTNSLLSNAFSWASYTEIIKAKFTYPNSALIGMRVDAEQFSSIPSRSYLVKGVKVQIPSNATVDPITGALIYSGIWNGTFNAATWTSDPAWVLWDLLVSTRYGFGDHIQAADLDKWSFYAASRYCSAQDTRIGGTTDDYHPTTGRHGVPDGSGGYEPRFSCNTVIQTAEDAYKLINDLLSVFRCQGFWDAGSLTIAQDRPADAAYLFTNANVSAEGFSYTNGSLKTRPNVVVVSYMDIGKYDYLTGKWIDGLRDTAYEVVEDVKAIDKYGVVKSEVSAFACTSRGQANRIGRWMLYTERYGEVVSFTASLDGNQHIRPGQVIAISDPVRSGSRLAGRIASATTTTITVDDTTSTDLSYDGSSILSVILPDGSVEQRGVSNITGAVITLQSDLTVAPNSNSVWLLERSAVASTLWRVLAIQEQDNLAYAISAVAHDPSKYTYVEQDVPLQPRNTTTLNAIPSAPTDLSALDIPLRGGGTTKEVQYDLNGRIAIKITFSWRGPQGIKNFRMKYRFEDDNFTTTTVQGTTFDIEDAKPGTYYIEVSSINASNILYSEPAQANYTVQGLGAPPADVSSVSIVALNESVAMLTWTPSDELDVKLGGKVIIRHDPRPKASAEWAASTQIVEAVAGSSSQKQVPLLPGTYFVKFQDYLGNRSINAVGAEVALPDYQSRKQLDLYVSMSYVDDYYIGGVQWQEQLLASPFSGAGTNCVYSDTETALVIAGGAEYVVADYVAELYASSDAVSTYTSLGYWEPIYAIGDLQAEYIFAETLDMGAVYDVLFRRYALIRSVATSILFDDAGGLFDSRSGLFDGETVDAVNLITYIRATNDDPSGTPTWGPWVELINAAVQGRAFQCKAIITSNSDSVNCAVETLQIIPELFRRFTANSIPTTANAITFDHAFYDLNSINITATTMSSDYSYTLTDASRSGFTATFRQGGEAVAQPYTYTVIGYGREV